MQRKEPFFRPIVTAEDKLREYRETLVRLREIATASPLHPVSAQVIRNCLALIELCWAVPTNESRDAIVGQMKRMADTMRAHSETFRNAGPELARHG
jgi:hypothetical protein